VQGEAAENFERKDFTWSEAVAIKRALEPAIREAAKERQGTRTDLHPGKLPQGAKGRARDQVAVLTGRKARSLNKAEAIVAAAEAEPERFAKLVHDMDRTDRADGPFKRLKVMRQAEAIRREPPPFPQGPFRCMTIDPPWPYEADSENPSQHAIRGYPLMSLAEIAAMGKQVRAMMHEDASAWLWVIEHYLRQAIEMLEDAWGLKKVQTLTWGKPHFGRGDYLREQTEFCLVGVRGNPVFHPANDSNLLHAPVRASGQKPREFYELVERVCPAPRYASLFHRGPLRDLWEGHGDECEQPDDDEPAEEA
jgi:N6-adenosine-specific RNA methylase IME4